ncbi:hypothetical protein [Sphingomonas sp. CFBP 13706]|uniref:hypothetical protein n=1 Tax=Sphingomonas sp. CFBP 13706 TaxID=2775314 RepID=UPI001784502D|nr:hypothetical protein [Sphingomonas sp. CFBP 13706]MBD8735711.1 hypothetical protein [Sphingomonas sp. CFBP 13706]
MWLNNRPFLSNWYGGPAEPHEVLYEFGGPAIYLSYAGPATFIFFKVDEQEESDLYLAAPISDEELIALRGGKLSIRGAMSHREAWLAEVDFEFNVLRYQEQSYEHYGSLLPRVGIALYEYFGEVPDTLEQAEAFISFKFESSVMSAVSMPLSVLRNRVEAVSEVVRSVMMPSRLSYGSKTRFFDPEVIPLRFDSLLIAIKEPQFDEEGLRLSKETAGFTPESLISESEDLGTRFVEELDLANQLARRGRLTRTEADRHFELLDTIVGLVPTTKNDLTRLQVGLKTNTGIKLVSIDKHAGDNIVAARRSIEAPIRDVTGVISEVNDEAKTFIVKDAGGRLTTVNPLSERYKDMNDRSLMKIGQRVKLKGKLFERVRRDYLILTADAEPLLG